MRERSEMNCALAVAKASRLSRSFLRSLRSFGIFLFEMVLAGAHRLRPVGEGAHQHQQEAEHDDDDAQSLVRERDLRQLAAALAIFLLERVDAFLESVGHDDLPFPDGDSEAGVAGAFGSGRVDSTF